MQTPHKRAAKIIENMQGGIGYLRSVATESYHLVTDGGDPQAVFDSFPDIDPMASAASALGFYAGIYAALSAIGKADGLTPPNLNIFQPQPDGTVLYVAPPEPEPAP
jgi:hypothetical protein